MLKIDLVSGVTFRADNAYEESLEFVDVAPYITTSNPKTKLHPSVSVTWGRKLNCCGGLGRYGVRYEYCLARLADGQTKARLLFREGPVAWTGKLSDSLPVEDCPPHVHAMALDALRREQSRRFDGCTYRPVVVTGA